MVNSLQNQDRCVTERPPLAKKMKLQLTAIPKEILEDLQYNLIDVKLHQLQVLDRSDFILLNSYSTNEEKVEMLMELMRNKTEEDHDNFLEVMQEDYNWLRDKCEIFLQKIRLDALKNGVKTRPVPSPPGSPDENTEPPSTEESDRSGSFERRGPSSPDSTVISHGSVKKMISTPFNTNKIDVAIPKKNDTKLSQTITPEMMTVVRRNHRVVRKWSTLAHNLGMTSIVHTLRMRMVMNGEDQDTCVLHLLEEWKGAQPKEASLGKLISALREEDFNDVADELEEKYAL